MIKIDSVELFLCEFKSEGLNYSTWSTNSRKVLIYKLVSGRHVGWGESTVNYNCLGVAKRIAKKLVGKDASRKERLLDPALLANTICYQYYAGFNRRFRQVREGFSQALWDLHGKVINKPFSEMINNDKSDYLKCQEGMPVIHVYAPEEMARIAELWIKKGFRTFKLKLRGNAKKDIEAMKMVKSLCSDVEILIGDANYGYKSFDELHRAVEGFLEYDLGYMQNPIRKLFWQYQGLSKSLGIKFTSDNTAYWPNTRRVISFQEAEILNLHPNIMGGVDYIFKLVYFAEKHRIPTITGGSGFFGIQDKCYQKMSFLINSDFPTENIGLQNYFCSDFDQYYKYEFESTSILTNDLEVSNGKIFDRRESGFGIDVDISALERVTKKMFVYN